MEKANLFKNNIIRKKKRRMIRVACCGKSTPKSLNRSPLVSSSSCFFRNNNNNSNSNNNRNNNSNDDKNLITTRWIGTTTRTVAAIAAERSTAASINNNPRRIIQKKLFTTTTTTTTSTASNATEQQQQQQQRKARVVIVGSGRMGQIRASLIQANPRLDCCGIVDVDIEKAKSLADQFGLKAFPNLQAAVDDVAFTNNNNNNNNNNNTNNDKESPSLLSTNIIDGIIVSSPTFTHGPIIQEAIDIKKKTNNNNNNNDIFRSVFTEKPVDETSRKIERLFQKCDDAGMQLCCGFQRRFDVHYRSAYEQIVKQRKIGNKVLYSNIFFADHPLPSKEFLLSGGGDIFMDLSAHDVDFIIDVISKLHNNNDNDDNNNDNNDDDEVLSVYATGTSSDQDLADAGVYDSGVMVMNFKKGSVVTLFMSRSATYGYDQRCEIFGDQGLLSIGNVHENTTVLSNKDGIHSSRLQYSFPQRFQDAFYTELDRFADTLLLQHFYNDDDNNNKEEQNKQAKNHDNNMNNTPIWPVTPKQCIQVQRVADAAYLSSKKGRVVYIREIVGDGTPMEEEEDSAPAIPEFVNATAVPTQKGVVSAPVIEEVGHPGCDIEERVGASVR